ncbi:MAG: hypothetical protein FWE07_04850 [Turicibacter sp.]|nr:hypothetical protein [Turicibacter sp.]
MAANFLGNRHGMYFLMDIADIAMWIGVAVMLFVCVHYIKYFRFWLRF